VTVLDGKVRVAALPATSAFLDRDATVDVLVTHIKEAAAHGAHLAALPEAIIPGYPD
jgi:nitrilase